MANLEGDIAAYIVGMDDSSPSKIDDPTNNFATIHSALQDYFECKWDNRAIFFLKMIGGKFDAENSLTNRNEIEEKITDHLSEFSAWYLALRMKDKESGGIEEFNDTRDYFEPVSKEVGSIFIDGLLHVVNKPKDMITARTNPEPNPLKKTIFEKNKERTAKIEQEIKNSNLFN